jgi:hypothetical protein
LEITQVLSPLFTFLFVFSFNHWSRGLIPQLESFLSFVFDRSSDPVLDLKAV